MFFIIVLTFGIFIYKTLTTKEFIHAEFTMTIITEMGNHIFIIFFL